MTTFFISDLHIDEHHPEATNCLLNFLETQGVTADAIYILGDLFEVWIGDDNATPFNKVIFSAFKKLTQAGVPMYFMRGNRDFLVGRQFTQLTGVKVLPDPCLIDLYGEPTLLMHGDLLCTDDQKYQAFRRKAHNPLLQKLFLLLPLSWRQHLATKAREKSQQHTQQVNLTIQDVNQAEVEKIMRHYKVNLLIHGHTHRPAVHEFQLDNKTVKRVVLNAWHEHGGGLTISSDKIIHSFTLNFTKK